MNPYSDVTVHLPSGQSVALTLSEPIDLSCGLGVSSFALDQS
jgi:hypothetical protein